MQPTAGDLLALLGSAIKALARIRQESGIGGMEPEEHVFAKWDIEQAKALGATAIVDDRGRIVVRFES